MPGTQLIFRIILGSLQKTVECIFIKSSGFHGKWGHYFFWNGRLLLTLSKCFSYCAKNSSRSRNKYTSGLLLKAVLKSKCAAGQSDLPFRPVEQWGIHSCQMACTHLVAGRGWRGFNDPKHFILMRQKNSEFRCSLRTLKWLLPNWKLTGSKNHCIQNHWIPNMHRWY